MTRPRFCPQPGCINHHKPNSRNTWYRSAGTYLTQAFGMVRRFRCTACGKYFSTQTFSIDYYSKRTISYQRLFTHLITTSSIRDMARDFSVSPTVILNKLARLARNSTVILQRLQQELSLDEDLAADGFESFTVSQYFPCHINLFAGKRSQLVYWYDYVTLRRKGRMTEEQKQRREQLEKRYRADPKGVEQSFHRGYDYMAHLICDGRKQSVVLNTDEHPAYQRAKRSALAFRTLHDQGRLYHRCVSSKAARTRRNPLFPVNYLDRQLRKDLSEHVRESVCFGRNVNRVMDRCSIYVLYHNLKKPYRESRRDYRSHAEVAGLDRAVVGQLLYGLYSRRMFRSRVMFDEMSRKRWLRMYETPLKVKREYVPKHVAEAA
jgi:hypothetical protein